MTIIEYDEWPEGTMCVKCGCDDSTIDFVPTDDGDWVCCECFSRQAWGEDESEDENTSPATGEGVNGEHKEKRG
jgi:hypothetical protein